MKKLKNAFFYLGIIGSFSILMYWIILLGAKLEEGKSIIIKVSEKGHWANFIESFIHNLEHPLALLLAQIITIIIVAKLFGWVCTKIRQPTVIGEMIAGIVLGPSLVGLYFPEFSSMLFPQQSLGNLQFLSQIGLILFMFIVGMELDLKVLKNKAHDAVVISHASIILPFALGMGLAYFIYQSFAPEGIHFLSFGLFIGIAMSITAFPVLARIVQERNIHKTKLGTIVFTCAAADDITAWCILAAVIAIAKAGSIVSSFYTIVLALTYVFLMIKIVKPFLTRIGNIYASKESLTKPIVAIFFLVLILSSYSTEVIGIHALFGAFMAGAIMPDNVKFRNLFIEKVEDVALVILLPLFFVFTGLRTEIGLLNNPELWKLTGIIILLAIVGKFIGSALAAKYVGQSWKDSLSIGALMNTRGLMELVVLNIGYDLGVLTPELFSMMVIMALTTTFMTGPSLDLINWIFKSNAEEIPVEDNKIKKYKILLSFGKPETGRILLKLANGLTKKVNQDAIITAMHLSPINELNQYNLEQYEKESFMPIVQESKIINQKITTLFKVSADFDSEITEVANKGDYSLLLIGLGESIYKGSLLGNVLGFTTRIINPEKLLNTLTGKENIFDSSLFDERTHLILSKSKVPVGILINKNFTNTDNVFIPFIEETDIFLIMYALKLINNSDSKITLWDISGQNRSNTKLTEKLGTIGETFPNNVIFGKEKIIDKVFLANQDLMLVSIDSWETLISKKHQWLSDIPSTLIIKEEKNITNDV